MAVSRKVKKQDNCRLKGRDVRRKAKPG